MADAELGVTEPVLLPLADNIEAPGQRQGRGPTNWTPTTANTPATIARLSGLGTPIVAENSAARHRQGQGQTERKKAGASA